MSDSEKRAAHAAVAIIKSGPREAMNEYNFIPKKEKNKEVQI